MRENRTYGSEGGEVKAFPTPISRRLTFPAVCALDARLHEKHEPYEARLSVVCKGASYSDADSYEADCGDSDP